MSVSDSLVCSQLLTYEDPEGFHGFLAYSGVTRPLAAGGMRVQQGLTGETILALAEAMRLKQDILQLNVDGAKCGIDFDPSSPHKQAAMRRFLRWLKPQLEERLSVGPDMGTTFTEIEAVARLEGIPSVKDAIAGAQRLPEPQVLSRLKTLDSRVGALTVGQRRAGHALAHAAIAAARHSGRLAAHSPLTCALQGFGTLGRGAAATLQDANVRLTALADEHGCIRGPADLDIERLLASPHRMPVIEHRQEGVSVAARESILQEPADILLLAACEDAIAPHEVPDVAASIVVVGANNGLTPAVEEALHERGVLVIPDFVGGAGGSAAMDALFAPAVCPDPLTVLARIALLARTLVERTLSSAESCGVSPREAALAMAHEAALAPDARPYGLRLLHELEAPAAVCRYGRV